MSGFPDGGRKSMPMADGYESFDLIVVGAGLGGLSAALRGTEHGLRTLLVEAGSDIGGTAYFSGGGLHIWGTETWEEYRRHTPLSDERLTRALFDGFRPYVDWLTSTGAPGAYERTVIRGLGLLKYQLGRTMAPHHRRRWFDHLAARYRAAGGTLLTRTRVVSLHKPDSRVCAIEVDDGDRATTLEGKAVILAAGGFQAAPGLLARHIGLSPDAIVCRAVETDIGDGLRMALEAGAAATAAMDSIYGHLMPAAPCRIDWRDPMAPITLSAFYAQHGIVVNAAGRRFVDERAGELNGMTINAAARESGNLWVIMDDAIRRGPARYEVPRELLRLSSLRYARLLRHARVA
jgi:succinate dehydrogenase/fumarate reductase flavoprotein subunit